MEAIPPETQQPFSSTFTWSAPFVLESKRVPHSEMSLGWAVSGERLQDESGVNMRVRVGEVDRCVGQQQKAQLSVISSVSARDGDDKRDISRNNPAPERRRTRLLVWAKPGLTR